MPRDEPPLLIVNKFRDAHHIVVGHYSMDIHRAENVLYCMSSASSASLWQMKEKYAICANFPIHLEVA